ncbi:MAG: tyrosine-type recombinase/integrase [Chloroflexales bacterium]
MNKRRRGAGEGSIYQRADGSWCAIIDLGIINGKRKRKFVYGTSRKEVAEKLKQLLHQQQQGLNVDPERITVGEFLDRWLEEVIKPHRRARTYRSYADTIRLHLKPRVGQHQLTKLTAAHVQSMINQLAAASGARTTQYARAVLQRALNRAVKWDLVARNVVLATDPPTSRPRTITPLTEEEARRLLVAVAGHRLEALYRLALSLGLRRGEVLGLRWADLDFTKKLLRITGALQRVQGKLERSEPKTRAGARTLLLPDVLVALLAEHQRRQAEERSIWGVEWQEHDLVFPTERGTPMEPSNLNRHFKAALKRAELPSTTRFHDLRHSCATFLIAQGVHPRVVMEILGHSQISLTMNTYGHVLPETQREATTKVADLFGKPAPEPEAEPEASDTPEAPEEAPQSGEPEDEGTQPETPTDDGAKRLYNAEDDNSPA